jgi:hypothetical protein
MAQLSIQKIKNPEEAKRKIPQQIQKTQATIFYKKFNSYCKICVFKY